VPASPFSGYLLARYLCGGTHVFAVNLAAAPGRAQTYTAAITIGCS
jgi:hypothetical protein